ncbi:MAG: TSUP family transporter [Limisphaera sp.]|nr:TSUP family transporter [Limisphaera sp.]
MAGFAILGGFTSMTGMDAWPWLLLAGAAAGWMDAIAGGGGLITVPALLACGLPPQVALGTNKLQAIFGSGMAAWQYRQAGLVSARACARGILLAFAGAALGAATVQVLGADILRRLLPLLLLGATLLIALRRDFGAAVGRAGSSGTRVDRVAAPLLGFYDGFFGPGTGTFWTVVLVRWGGLELTRATARTKMMNFASNAGALAVFAVTGALDVRIGLLMGCAQAAGAQLGARMAAARGRKFIRPIFLAVVVALTIRVAWDAWRSSPGAEPRGAETSGTASRVAPAP